MSLSAPVLLSSLADLTVLDGTAVRAGCYGVSHGSGLLGELIRHATESWAGHAFIYIGDGRIVEGTAPVAQITSVSDHPDAVWNLTENLTDTQRLQIVARAHALVGTHYDWPAYVGFALETLHLKSRSSLDPVFQQDRWRVCSALVADCYGYAGIHIDPGDKDYNLTSPADLYDRIAHQK